MELQATVGNQIACCTLEWVGNFIDIFLILWLSWFQSPFAGSNEGAKRLHSQVCDMDHGEYFLSANIFYFISSMYTRTQLPRMLIQTLKMSTELKTSTLRSKAMSQKQRRTITLAAQHMHKLFSKRLRWKLEKRHQLVQSQTRMWWAHSFSI